MESFAPISPAAALTGPTEYSVYIPMVKVKFSIPVICNILSKYGLVERIDVVNRKNFSTKEIDHNYKRLYIHFKALYDVEIAHDMVNAINTYGNYRIDVETEESWFLYKSTKKIPYSEMNIHQLAHTYNIIDDKVIDLDHEMFQTSARIEELEERNSNLENMVFELQATILEMQRHLMQLSERER